MRKGLIGGIWVLAAAVGAQPALAHPHIFIDATVEVVFDALGRAEGLRIGWTYDDLMSLTFVTERGLDPDFDGVLTEAERASLNGFDMAWQPGFAGDTYALLNSVPLALSGPSDWSVSYADGKVTSGHYRRFDAPVDLGGAALVVQVYDPGYYTSYVLAEAHVAGRSGCQVDLFEPDRDAADQTLQDALAEYSASDAAEADFPAVGAAYAEEAQVTCEG